MEISKDVNERTPLLQNAATSNGHRLLCRLSANPKWRIPGNGNQPASDEHDASSNVKMIFSRNSDGHDNASNLDKRLRKADGQESDSSFKLRPHKARTYDAASSLDEIPSRKADGHDTAFSLDKIPSGKADQQDSDSNLKTRLSRNSASILEERPSHRGDGQDAASSLEARPSRKADGHVVSSNLDVKRFHKVDGQEATSILEARPSPKLNRYSTAANLEAKRSRKADKHDVPSNLEAKRPRKADGHDVPSNLEAKRSHVVRFPTHFDLETDEVSLDEVVVELSAAWRRNRQPKDEEVALEFFDTIELYAMHVAWREITDGKRCYFAPHTIAKAVAAAIAVDTNPRDGHTKNELLRASWKLCFEAEKDLIGLNILREWVRITEGVGFPDHYTPDILENSVRSPSPPECCPSRSELLYKMRECIVDPRFQIFLNSLLIIWPIFIIIVGKNYMHCPMNYRLSYLLILLGVVGCLAIVSRVALVYITSKCEDPDELFWEWIGLRLIELTFLIVFIIQAFYFFSTSSPEPDANQCREKYYTTAKWIDYASFALVSIGGLVYFIQFCRKKFYTSH